MVAVAPKPVVYPESDGLPMSDNTLQFDTIAYLVAALRRWFSTRDDVFVAGDLLWYFEEGNPVARVAPDGLVAFGRPAGYRGSYLQWLEDGVCPQVVFEVLSPNNSVREMQRKYALYARLGCEEYYLIDPDDHAIEGFRCSDGAPSYLDDAVGAVSPRLGLELVFIEGSFRFVDPASGDMLPDYQEVAARADEAAARADEAAARAERLAVQLRSLGVDPVG